MTNKEAESYLTNMGYLLATYNDVNRPYLSDVVMEIYRNAIRCARDALEKSNDE